MLDFIRKAIRTVFIKNIRTKTTALIFAVAIWSIVSFEVSEEYSRDDIVFEVLPVHQDAPIENMRAEPEQIVLKARFICPRRIGQQYLLPASKIKAVHKLEDPRIGEPISVRVGREDFNLPPDVRLLSVEPDNVQVTLRQITAKKLRVEVVTRGKPAEGYELSSKPTAEPTEVTVRGPKEVIEPLATIPTEYVVIEGKSISFTSDYPIVDKVDGHRIECQTKVRIKIPIAESMREAVLNIPVFVQTPPNYKYSVTLVGAGNGNIYPLKVKGPKNILDSPDTAAKLTAFVVITPDLLPRPGVAYYRTVFLTPSAEVRDIELAEEKQIGVEIGEPQQPEPEEPKSP